MSNFAERLKALTISNKINLRTLAIKIDVSSSQLSHYANGKYDPTVVNAIKIANYFKCSLDYLFGLDDNILRHPVNNFESVTTFKERLKYLIGLRKSNINQISKHTYINRNCIYAWFQSNSFPKTNLLSKLAKELNTSIEYLIGRIDLVEV